MPKYAAAARREGWSWSWMGICSGDNKREAMAGVAISAVGYDENHMSTDEILNEFYEAGWRARLYELKEHENRDEFETKLEDLI